MKMLLCMTILLSVVFTSFVVIYKLRITELEAQLERYDERISALEEQDRSSYSTYSDCDKTWEESAAARRLKELEGRLEDAGRV